MRPRICFTLLLPFVLTACSKPSPEPLRELTPYEAGREHLWQEKYDEAIADFTEAIRLDPNNASAYFNRGLTWGNKKQHDKAFEDYTETLRLEPTHFAALINRGRIYLQKRNEADKAIVDFSEAIRLEPENEMGWFNRSAAWDAKEIHDKAIADLTEAIRLKPDHFEAFANRGSIWHTVKEDDKAIEDYNEAIRLMPDHPLPYSNRGNAWSSKKAYDKAIADYDHALELNAKWFAAYQNLAYILATCPNERYRNKDRAIEYGLKSCEISKWEDTSCIQTLAAVYAETGQFDEAVRFQKIVVERYKNTKTEEYARSALTHYEKRKTFRDDP